MSHSGITNRYPVELTDEFEFDFLVFIGRFQPFHIGHQAVIDEALKQSRRVIVLVGSSSCARTVRNPWSYGEREDVLMAHYKDQKDRVLVTPIQDHTYNEQAWVKEVQDAVQGLIATWGFSNSKIGLIGLKKDNSSYYLDLFPQWEGVSVKQTVVYSATAIRAGYFGEVPIIPAEILPYASAESLMAFHGTDQFNMVYEDSKYVRDFIASWFGRTPHPVSFQTVDAVVVKSGFILLVKRGRRPGIGQWALPGGYMNMDETLEQAMLRELKEETTLDLTETDGSTVGRRTFDDPHRSDRGRVITEAFHIELPAGPLPEVEGQDDAAEAKWWPLSEIVPERMFEDHYHIINTLVGLG